MYAYVYCTAGHDVSQLTAERIHQYEPFAATFNIAKIQLELHETQALGFAARLGMNFSSTTYRQHYNVLLYLLILQFLLDLLTLHLT